MLADPAFLQERLGLDVEALLVPANVSVGQLKMRRSKCTALVDDGGASKVGGEG